MKVLINYCLYFTVETNFIFYFLIFRGNFVVSITPRILSICNSQQEFERNNSGLQWKWYNLCWVKATKMPKKKTEKSETWIWFVLNFMCFVLLFEESQINQPNIQKRQFPSAFTFFDTRIILYFFKLESMQELYTKSIELLLD